MARRPTEESTAILDQVFAESPSFMATISVPELRYLNSNQEHQKLIRKSNIVGKTVYEVEPDIAAQGFFDLLQNVAKTGVPFVGKEVAVHYDSVGDEPAKINYLNFVYQPLRNSRGEIYAITAQGYDVTEMVQSRKAVENERKNFRNLFHQTPEIVCIMRGPSHQFEFVNEAHVQMLGFDATGKTIREAQPESTELHSILDKVYRTGETAKLHEIPARVGGEMKIFNLTYAVRRNDAGIIDGIMNLGTDVTDEVRARDLLAESEGRYRTLFESVDQGFCVLEMIYDGSGKPFDYKLIEVNPTFEKQTGLMDAQGKTAREMVPNLETIWFETYGKVVDSGKSIRFEQESPAMRRVFDVFAFKIGGTNSRRLGLLFSDITERKRAQIDFERNVDKSPAILWITERDGSCTYLSKQWYEFTGQTPEEALGFGWLDATHPDDKEKTANIYRQANEQQKTFFAEYRLRTKSGDYHWAIDAGNPRYDRDGNYLGYAGTVFDIHERITAEHRLKDLQARFQKSAEATDLGVWYCDLPFDELIWNKEVKNHFFLPADAHVTIDVFYERIHPDDRLSARLAIETSIQARIPYDTVYRTVDPTNSENIKFIRAVGWTDYGTDGTPLRFDGITLDVTAERFREYELKAAKEQAERANQLKSAFLANMSHEIRTPLGAMLGFADLLRDQATSKSDQSNYIDILVRSGEQLSVIINDILDLSKVEAGHLSLDYEDTVPRSIAEEVVSLLLVKANEKGLTLTYEADSSTPESVVADPSRVRQVLLNLVGNAIKFTPTGSVTLTSYRCTGDSGRTGVCFTVCDTGIGLDEFQRDKIFDVFVQADGSITRKFGGTGLGLTLSRRLARALGGDVTILESQKDRGSTFLFRFEDHPEKRDTQSMLPTSNRQAHVEPGHHDPHSLKDLRILVVDDAPENQELINRFLARHGAHIESAENGLQGYRKALVGDYDIVLMDIQMPEMDGYTATQMLRSAGYTKPIVALTAHAMSDVHKRCLNVGCSDFMAKPINPRTLVSKIAMHTAKSSATDT